MNVQTAINRFVLVAFSSMGLFNFALADVVLLAEEDCIAPEATVAMVNCMGRDYEEVDERLDVLYQQHRAGQDDIGRKLIDDAQRAWLEFRDAECKRARDAARGGTLASVLGSSCMVEMTRERIQQLVEGDTFLAENPAPVFWHEHRLTGRFNCEQIEDVHLGLIPGFDTDKGKQVLTARVSIGSESLDFPIGGDTQNAFCAPPAEMETYDPGNHCPGVRIEDGMCDAIFIEWNKKERRYIWKRN